MEFIIIAFMRRTPASCLVVALTDSFAAQREESSSRLQLLHIAP